MPKYELIYQDLMKKIDREEYKPHEKLPGEHELMEIYQVSRDTIRKALALLVQNGYIQKSKGRGSIVIERDRFELPVSGLQSFKEVSNKMGRRIQTEVVSIQKISANRKLMELFDISADTKIWEVKRVRRVDGERVILDIDYFNEEVVPYLDETIAEDSIYNYLENELDLKIAYADKQITCPPVDSQDQELLDMKDFKLLVEVRSFTYLDNAHIFQYTISRHRPDKFQFREFARRIQRV